MSYQEEVVGQDGDWEDVKELPSQEGGLQQAGRLDQRRVNIDLDADGDGGDRDKADDHGSLDVVGDEGDLESSHGCEVVSRHFGGISGARRTSVDGRDDAFHNDDREAVQSREEVDHLSDGRQFRHHVQEQGQHRHEAEVDGRDDSIALPGPFRQDKALRTLAADDGAEGGEDEERQARREGVDNYALYASNSGELGVSKEDTRSESCEDLAGQ